MNTVYMKNVDFIVLNLSTSEMIKNLGRSVLTLRNMAMTLKNLPSCSENVHNILNDGYLETDILLSIVDYLEQAATYETDKDIATVLAFRDKELAELAERWNEEDSCIVNEVIQSSDEDWDEWEAPLEDNDVDFQFIGTDAVKHGWFTYH